jgi:hypothetical protein
VRTLKSQYRACQNGHSARRNATDSLSACTARKDRRIKCRRGGREQRSPPHPVGRRAKTHLDGVFVRVAGCVIARQRPGTAKGFIFISMKDETGIANITVTPDLYEGQLIVAPAANSCSSKAHSRTRMALIHIKATRPMPLTDGALPMQSHDCH